jgi:hypothetical protein
MIGQIGAKGFELHPLSLQDQILILISFGLTFLGLKSYVKAKVVW